MDEVVESVTEAIVSGSGENILREYTDEEMQQQTTDFLLYLIDQMGDVSEEKKAQMRANILAKALEAGKLAEEVLKPKKSIEPTTPQDLIILVTLIIFIVGTLGKKQVFNKFLSVNKLCQSSILFNVYACRKKIQIFF